VDRLVLFDARTQKWTELAKIGVGWDEWSHNGDYVYILGGPAAGQPAGVFRVRISDHKLEQVVGLKDFRQAPDWGGRLQPPTVLPSSFTTSACRIYTRSTLISYDRH